MFVGPNGLADVRSATFALDGDIFSLDLTAPFDFAGTSSSRSCSTCAYSAFPFESNLLSVGSHRIDATLSMRNGTRVVLTATFTVANTTAHSLLVSASADRSAPKSLANASLTGRQHIFLGPANDSIDGLNTVVFFIDGFPVNTDSSAPYDALDTKSNGQATPLDTRVLRNGKHRATAVVWLRGGGLVTYSVEFRVAN